MVKTKLNELHIDIFAMILSVISFAAVYFLNVQYNVISTIIMFITGIILFIGYAIESKTLITNQGIFSAIWFGTIGLSLLRFNTNQVPWKSITWLVLLLAYIFFILGNLLYYLKDTHSKDKPVTNTPKKLFGFSVERKFISQKGFFIGVLLFSLVCIGAFLFEWLKLGFLPILSSDMNAYVKFHIKGIHYFTVSSVLIFPLTYIYLKHYKSSVLQKIVLVILNIAAFLIPLAIVSRQLYMMDIVIAAFTIIIEGNKKILKQIIVIVLAMVIILGGWLVSSKARNQDETYLNNVFDSSAQEYIEDEYSSGNSSQSTVEQAPFDFNDFNKYGTDFSACSNIKLPMKIYSPYMYVAFNYDNLNYAMYRIQDNHSYGLQTTFPLFALTYTKNYVPYNNYPSYNYLQVYTTYPIAYTFYYDFGILGSLLFILLGFITAKISRNKKKNPIVTIISSIIKYALAFAFFTNFFANATIWFYFALLFVINIVVNYKFTKIKQTNAVTNN